MKGKTLDYDDYKCESSLSYYMKWTAVRIALIPK